MRVIARGLHRSPSTISREITRHGGRTQYRANAADQQAWESAVRPKPCLLATHSELQQMVASKLMQDWSPQQVSGWLKMEYPNDESLRVSHETIYRSLFIQARGALKQELVRHLRSQRRIRRSRTPAFTGTRKAASSMPSRFVSGQQKSKIAPFPVIGRAICCAGRATVTWSRWWSAVRASACW
jgi:IS30 family transposase